MKVILTGSTGMVGKGVLLECLDDPSIESVLLINRTPLNHPHKKIKEIIHKDFFDLGPISDQLKGYDACFFCLGVSVVGMSETSYHRMTYDLTLHAAKIMLEQNPKMIFCYVTGAGTDSTEKGSAMWARVKGKTENALLSLPFKGAYMFRPGYIHPMRGIQTKTWVYKIFYVLFKPFFPLVKRFAPNHVTTSVAVGQAMIRAALHGSDKKILEIPDINHLAQKGDKK